VKGRGISPNQKERGKYYKVERSGCKHRPKKSRRAKRDGNREKKTKAGAGKEVFMPSKEEPLSLYSSAEGEKKSQDTT